MSPRRTPHAAGTRSGTAKVAYLNPPLLVPADPIDYPPFGFLGALHGAGYLARQGVDVSFIDAFPLAEPTPLPDGWIRLGPTVDRLLAEAALDDVDLVVIHQPPVAWLERNLTEVLAPLVDALKAPGRTLALADGALSESHYISADPAWLLARFSALDHFLLREPEKPLEALLRRGEHPRLITRGADSSRDADTQIGRWASGLDLVDVAGYVEWFRHDALRNLLHGYQGQRAIFPYLASRGCPFRCSFCTSEPGRRWVGLPLEQVRADLTTLAQRGVDQVWLLDPIANANRQRFGDLLDICAELSLGVAVPNGLRIDRLGPAEVRRLALVADRVPMSIESGDPAVLASLGKKLSLPRAEATLAAAAAAGLATQVHYLIGAPGEDAAAVNRTLSFALDAAARFGAEPLVQYYVSPDHLRVPSPSHPEKGLPDDFYEAFHRHPRGVDGGLPVGQLERFMDTFARKRGQRMQSKLIINVSYHCNNDCVFCSVGDRPRVHGRLEDQLAALETAAAEGIRLLDLDGGEPTQYPRLLTVIDHARALGFERITVTTNGRTLADGERTAALVQRGVELLVSLHGPTAEVQDGLTRAESSYEQTLAGLKHARRTTDRLGVNTTVVTGNLDHLTALADLLVSLGIRMWNLQLVTPFGNAAGNADLAPDWEAAISTVGQLLRSHSSRLNIQVVGLPLCGLDELEQHALDDHHKAVRRMLFADGELVNLGAYLDERRAHQKACLRCDRRLLCGGFWDFDTIPEASVGPQHYGERIVPTAAQVRMLDIIPGYACNVTCDYCSMTDEMRNVEMRTSEILPFLRQGREHGIDYVSFGGGEPTIRRDILKLTRAARDVGYQTIRYQTNGFMFAYPEFTTRAVDAGLNRLHLSLMTSQESLYDRITGFTGSRKIVLDALRNLRQHDVALVGDLIVKSDTYAHLADTITYFHRQGVHEFYLWLVSLTDGNQNNPSSLRRVAEMRPALEQALDVGRDLGIRVMSRHIPACMLPDHEDQIVKLGDEDVWVVTPETSFWLLESVISANRFAPRCEGCTRQGVCWGLRADYLERYGDDEVTPYRDK